MRSLPGRCHFDHIHANGMLAMEGMLRLTYHLLPVACRGRCLRSVSGVPFEVYQFVQFHHARARLSMLKHGDSNARSSYNTDMTTRRSHSAVSAARAGWLFGLGEKQQKVPDTVKAGDPVLHEAAQEVPTEEIKSERIQNIIDDMIKVMRQAPGVGLAAPQIGIPLKIIVLEDTKDYISYAPKDEIKAQDRRPFELLVVVNPKLKKKSNRSALFFEGCLSVDGFRAVVERYLDVEVIGFDRYGQPLKVDASGWQARILQHECDHLDGTLYVDKMVPRTFRTVENLDLPLADGCPKLGAR